MRRKFIPEINGPQFARNLLANLAGSLILSVAQPVLAQVTPKNYASPQQASQALYESIRNKDDSALQAILGGPQLVSTGNDAEDEFERERFAQKYREMHRLVRERGGSVVLYIGAENWPFPIPLVFARGKWRFDPDVGAGEIRAREIGENEMSAIQVSEALSKNGSAQSGTVGVDDSIPAFVRDVTESGAANSPISKLFHGYFFRVFSEDTGNAVVVAYPSEYGNTGVMTFIGRGDAVFERDLGPDTAAVAQRSQGKLVGDWNRVK